MMHRHLALSAALLSLTALTTACDEQVDPALEGAYALADMLPTSGDVRVETPASSSARSSGELDAYYMLTREASSGVNSLVENWLDTVHDIVRLTPALEDDGGWAWGPLHQGEGGLAPTTEYLLASQNDDGSYNYALIEAARADEDDRGAYEVIVAGQVLGGSNIEDSWGWFAVDFTTAQSLDPMRDLSGEAVFAYDFTGTTTADVGGGPLVVSAMHDIVDDGADPFSAVYGYYRLPSGGGVLDMFVSSDIGASADVELWDIRSRWTASGEGRADVQVTGGDIGESVWTINDCWGEAYTTVYREDDLGWLEPVGSEDQCAFADESLPGTLPQWVIDLGIEP